MVDIFSRLFYGLLIIYDITQYKWKINQQEIVMEDLIKYIWKLLQYQYYYISMKFPKLTITSLAFTMFMAIYQLIWDQSPRQTPFLVVNQTRYFINSTLHLKAGDELTTAIKIKGGLAQYALIKSASPNSIQHSDHPSYRLSLQIVQQNQENFTFIVNETSHYFVVVYTSSNKIVYVHMINYVNGVVRKEKYGAITNWKLGMSITQVTIQNNCQTVLRTVSDQSQLKIYTPNSNIFDPPYLTLQKDRQQTYAKLSAGTWKIVTIHPAYSANRTNRFIINITTLESNECLNLCSKQPYTAGLAPGTTDVCLCDERYEYLIWNNIKKRCQCSVQNCLCGNSVIDEGEECDNGEGCKECKVESGYECRGQLGKKSSCWKVD